MPGDKMTQISFNDFKKLDLRICKVLKAERIPGRKKLLKLTVKLGEDDVRTVIAGGAQYYPPEYFVNKLFVIVANLEPKRIAGIESEGMLLAADHHGKPIWLTVKEEVPPGTKVR